MSDKLHAHVRIEYTHEDGGQVETLVGFCPWKEAARKMVHEMLDEYLDYLKRR